MRLAPALGYTLRTEVDGELTWVLLAKTQLEQLNPTPGKRRGRRRATEVLAMPRLLGAPAPSSSRSHHWQCPAWAQGLCGLYGLQGPSVYKYQLCNTALKKKKKIKEGA